MTNYDILHNMSTIWIGTRLFSFLLLMCFHIIST